MLAVLAAAAALAAPSPGPLVVHFAALSRRPRAGEPWPYAVAALDRRGRPLRGSVRVRITLGPLVVGEVGRHAFDGIWAESLSWPKESVGQRLTLEVAVSAAGARRVVRYDVEPTSAPGRSGETVVVDGTAGKVLFVRTVRRPRRARLTVETRRGPVPVRWSIACNRGSRVVVTNGSLLARGTLRRAVGLPAYTREDCALGVLAVGPGAAATLLP